VIGTEVYDVGPLSVSFIVRKYLSKDAEAFWRVFRKIGNSRVSVVPVVTRYRMEGLGFEPPWWQFFVSYTLSSLCLTQPLASWLTRI